MPRTSDLSIEEAEDLGATIGALLGLGLAGEDAMAAGAAAAAAAGAYGYLIDEAEVWDVADLIEPGSAAAVALIERVWAVPSRDAITRAGGVSVSGEWVPVPGRPQGRRRPDQDSARQVLHRR